MFYYLVYRKCVVYHHFARQKNKKCVDILCYLSPNVIISHVPFLYPCIISLLKLPFELLNGFNSILELVWNFMGQVW